MRLRLHERERIAPTTADEIFATGTSIKLTDKNKLSIRVPVDKQITYAVIAAAANQTGKTISTNYNLPRSKDEDPGTEDPEPKPEQIDITFQQENYFICLTACY